MIFHPGIAHIELILLTLTRRLTLNQVIVNFVNSLFSAFSGFIQPKT